MTFETSLWIQAHRDFASIAPDRTLIFAKGSSHDSCCQSLQNLIVEATGKIGVINSGMIGVPQPHQV